METHEQAVKRGKKSKTSGAAFERKVRADLESKGWIVAKWMNQVDLKLLEDDVSTVGGKTIKKYVPDRPYNDIKLIPAKHKFCGVGRPMAIGTGFPDFVCIRDADCTIDICEEGINFGEDNLINRKNCKWVIGVEVKSNGYLKPEEKEKIKWLLENNVFSKILIASKNKVKNKINIEYKEFNGNK